MLLPLLTVYKIIVIVVSVMATVWTCNVGAVGAPLEMIMVQFVNREIEGSRAPTTEQREHQCAFSCSIRLSCKIVVADRLIQACSVTASIDDSNDVVKTQMPMGVRSFMCHR